MSGQLCPVRPEDDEVIVDYDRRMTVLALLGDVERSLDHGTVHIRFSIDSAWRSADRFRWRSADARGAATLEPPQEEPP